MPTRITYFAHGTTTDNERGIATGWLPGELSPLGREQAMALGRLVKAQDFDAVFCSDLARAIESARLTFGDGFDPRQDTRLRECNFGDLSGTPASGFKERLVDYISQGFPGGESLRDVELRLRAFLEDLRRQWDGRHIAIVGHQAPQLALEVLIGCRTWQEAIEQDWRRKGAWQPGWDYLIP